jgi:hypothetical protein
MYCVERELNKTYVEESDEDEEEEEEGEGEGEGIGTHPNFDDEEVKDTELIAFADDDK